MPVKSILAFTTMTGYRVCTAVDLSSLIWLSEDKYRTMYGS